MRISERETRESAAGFTVEDSFIDPIADITVELLEGLI
ncbi:hypothetical protein J2T22_004079 [Pseudarthrobacter defluvii]|uniref:Uncharacterized protein n=1 Tax=Pseudarthrobacter defluvii TaxID=410837 RepID=A0ABT9UR21_9MICC|nr:hypothetical protein [Pseudarthrobacter defluvii]